MTLRLSLIQNMAIYPPDRNFRITKYGIWRIKYEKARFLINNQ